MTINEYQEKVYQEILNELRDNNIVRIYGPSGVGKTTLINRFNQEKLSFFSFSEMDKDDDSLFSLVVSSSSFGNKLKNTDDTVSNLFEIDKLSVFKGPLKILFDIFSKTAAVSHKLNNFFSDQEINIIISLMKFTEKANKSNFYLIFDNCEYMNDRSAKFIRRLFINNDIRKALNNRLKLVFIENTTDNSSALSSLARANIKVEIDESTYYSYLKDTNHKLEYSYDDMKVLSSITSKDLDLTNALLKYFDNNNIQKDILSQSCTPERLVNIFNEMISKHLVENTNEINCLEVASILGTIINAYDLSKLTNLELELVLNSLSFGIRAGLIKENTPDYSIVSFLHPVIKDILYKKLQDKEKHHIHYSSLLKKKYPTKHLVVAENLYRGNINVLEVLHEFYTHLTMLTVRGELSQFDYQSYMNKYASNKSFKTFTDCFYNILLNYESNNLNKAYKNIKDISPIDIPDDFCKALINYMEARIRLINGNSNETFVEIKNLLMYSSEIFLSANMVDLYFDSLTVLINVFSYKLSDLQSARIIEEQYIKKYHEIQCNTDDSELEDSYIDFMRRTASLLDAQGAYERMKNLFCRHVLKDYLQKYKAYSDMIGYSLYAGEFETAYEYAQKIHEYVDINQFYNFPEIFKVVNNILLANLFYENVNNHFVTLINEGIDSLLEYEDRSDVTNVIKLNLACLYMLVGKYNEAENRLIELSDTLNNYSNALYATYVPSNLAALYLLKGDFAKASQFNSIAKKNLYRWDKNYQLYYVHQNEYVMELIKRKTVMTPFELFLPDSTSEISAKTYKFVGRGIMMSELLFYTL